MRILCVLKANSLSEGIGKNREDAKNCPIWFNESAKTYENPACFQAGPLAPQEGLEPTTLRLTARFSNKNEALALCRLCREIPANNHGTITFSTGSPDLPTFAYHHSIIQKHPIIHHVPRQEDNLLSC